MVVIQVFMPPESSVFQKIIRKDAGLIRSGNSCFHGDRKGIAPFTTSRSSIPIHTTIRGGGGGVGVGSSNNNNNNNELAKHPQGHYKGSVGTYF